jgi:hypothetical protein
MPLVSSTVCGRTCSGAERTAVMEGSFSCAVKVVCRKSTRACHGSSSASAFLRLGDQRFQPGAATVFIRASGVGKCW